MNTHPFGTFGDNHRWFRTVTGLMLITTTIISVATAIAVSTLRIGFTPVLTDSMSPTLDAGSVAITRQISTEDLSIGDVVILPLPDSDGQRYLHRLIDVQHVGNATHVRTKGDQNPLVDPWTLQVTSSTAPVAIGSIPYLGWTTNVLRGTLVRLLFAGFVMILVVIGMIRLRRQMLRSHRHDGVGTPSGSFSDEPQYLNTV